MPELKTSELTALIEALVRIDSVNPALDPRHEGETEIARFVHAWGEEHALETRWLERAPGRPSVILRASGASGGPTLLLYAHLDTVGVTGMTAPFEPTIEDDIMHGRGVMDMKASLAACMLTVRWAAEQRLPGNIILAAVADEEHASLGIEEALQAVTAEAAILTEPTNLDLHVAHRGFVMHEVEFTGKASHTSRPQDGVNAVTHLGCFLHQLEQHDRELLDRPAHPLLGHGSLQAVLVEGGSELFTTPAQARVSVERRTVPGETVPDTRAELDAIVRGMMQRDPSVRAEITQLLAREPFEVAPESSLVELLAETITTVQGSPPGKVGAPYWTDAALVAAAGIPTVLFGPRGGAIHQPDEWLDLASAHTLLEVLKQFCARFPGAPLGS